MHLLRQKKASHFPHQKVMAPANHNAKLLKMKHYIDCLCGVYSRIARRLGVDRTYVSKVAKGERHSPEIEVALTQEFDRVEETAPD